MGGDLMPPLVFWRLSECGPWKKVSDQLPFGGQKAPKKIQDQKFLMMNQILSEKENILSSWFAKIVQKDRAKKCLAPHLKHQHIQNSFSGLSFQVFIILENFFLCDIWFNFFSGNSLVVVKVLLMRMGGILEKSCVRRLGYDPTTLGLRPLALGGVRIDSNVGKKNNSAPNNQTLCENFRGGRCGSTKCWQVCEQQAENTAERRRGKTGEGACGLGGENCKKIGRSRFQTGKARSALKPLPQKS